MNDAPLRDVLRHFTAIQLAAAAPDLVPESVRGFGITFDAGVLSLVVLDEQSAAFRPAAARAGRLAVNLTDPVTFRGLQVKGALVAIDEPSPHARAVAASYFEEFVRVLGGVGYRPEQVRGFFCARGGARWVRVAPEQLFDQSPGVGAGAAL